MKRFEKLKQDIDFSKVTDALLHSSLDGIIPKLRLKELSMDFLKNVDELLFSQPLANSESKLQTICSQLDSILELIETSYPDSWNSKSSYELIREFVNELPRLQTDLVKDVEAAFRGDPSAHDKHEVILSYPSLHALTQHRVASLFFKKDLPILPRLIS